MEETNKTNNDCGCEGDCCTPPKKKPSWMKWISILILVAAIAIVVVKLAGNKTTAVTEKQSVSACDTTKGAACDTSAGSSCCSKAGK